jgi:hypothetical protein
VLADDDGSGVAVLVSDVPDVDGIGGDGEAEPLVEVWLGVRDGDREVSDGVGLRVRVRVGVGVLLGVCDTVGVEPAAGSAGGRTNR